MASASMLVASETAAPRDVTLELVALRNGKTPVLKAERNIDLAARANDTGAAPSDLIGSFFDIVYSYRFPGAPQHDAITVRLLLIVAPRAANAGERAFHSRSVSARAAEPAEITAAVEMDREGWLTMTLSMQAASRASSTSSTKALRPSDNWFTHFTSGFEKIVRLGSR